jgi:serine/threonine protein kinase
MKTDANALIGQTFNEMYRIVRQIGTGGMGAVYESVHTRLANKKFAIKMLHASIAQDAEVFQRFRREAEIATELGHPNIVEVSDFNITPDGSPYMVMEFLDGEDLAARLQKRGPVTLEQLVRLTAEICSALEAAHGAGIVHRDLKPQNIFLCKKLGRDDFVKIVDFGISKVKDSSSVVTRDHSLMGTPFYMSPEQADGLVQQIDHRTDIFALGAILWEMLTGRMAFEAPTISGAMYKVVHVDAPEVHTLRPDVPPTVSMVLRRAMAKQKEWRYGSVGELAYELANACRGIAPSVAPPPLMNVAATMAPTPMMMQQIAAQTPARPMTPVPLSPHPGVRTGDAYAPTGFVASQPPQPMPPPPAQMPAPISTMSGAAAQVVATERTTPANGKRGRSALYGALAAVVILGGGVAAFTLTGGKPVPGAKMATNAPAAATPALTEPTPPPAPAPAAVPDAAPAAAVPAAAPVDPEVTLTFEIQYDKGKAPKLPAAKITVDGQPITGTTLKLKKGGQKLKVDVAEKGYSSYSAWVVPDGDKTISALLKPRAPGSPAIPTIGWVP